jgi:hypothetical protein
MYMGTLLTKVTQRVCDPEQLGATTSGNNILSFCGRLGYTRLFVRRPRNKRRTQKLARPEVDFLSTQHPTKSASEKPRSEREQTTPVRPVQVWINRVLVFVPVMMLDLV